MIPEAVALAVPIHSINRYMQTFYVFIIENLNRSHLTAENWERTISVSSCGIGPKVKRLSKNQKKQLIESGRQAATQRIKA